MVQALKYIAGMLILSLIPPNPLDVSCYRNTDYIVRTMNLHERPIYLSWYTYALCLAVSTIQLLGHVVRTQKLV